MLLKAQTREVVGKQVKTLRAQKLVPASVYGPNTATRTISVSDKEFRKLYNEVGYSSLFDLEIEGEKPVKALLKEIQVDRLKKSLIHASIYAVDMKKPINTEIPIRFEGTSMAVKNNLGLLVTSLDKLSINCLPADLPSEVVVDVSKLDNVGDSIFVRDLKLSDAITLSGVSKDAIIITIALPQKSIEEETPKVAAEGEADAEAEAKEETEASKE